MKIEVEVNDALVQAFGEEAIRDYLNHKLKQMEKSWQAEPTQNDLPPEAGDAEVVQKAWTQFNKRGMSC